MGFLIGNVNGGISNTFYFPTRIVDMKHFFFPLDTRVRSSEHECHLLGRREGRLGPDKFGRCFEIVGWFVTNLVIPSLFLIELPKKEKKILHYLKFTDTFKTTHLHIIY
jgi:hypothetical protein